MTLQRADYSEQQQGLFEKYLDLLQRWNKVHNLTALRSRAEMGRQLIDQSLLLASYLTGRVADIGTGSGIPGIPLAIARPDLEFTLIDSRTKKTVFVEQVVRELALSHVLVVKQRAEECMLAPFDTIVNRALGSIVYIDQVSASLRHAKTQLLCVRGSFDPVELSATSLQLVDCVSLSATEESNLVIMTP